MKILQEIVVPLESVNDQRLIVLDLFFNNGDKVSKGSIIAELETSKTTLTVETLQDGYVLYFCSAGDELPVNSLIAQISDEIQMIHERIVQPQKPKNQLSVNNQITLQIEKTIFSKEALLMLASHSVDKVVFAGRDFIGRKEVEDLLRIGRSSGQPIVEARTSDPSSLQNEFENIELKKITSYKKREIEYLNGVQSAGLVSIINIVVEMDGVTEYLSKHLRYFKNSLLPIVMFECSRLLKKYKEFNAYFTEGSIAFYKNVNIGFAVDMEKGLKVLKVSKTDGKTIYEIEDEIFQLSNHYVDDKIKTESLTEITFTITDLSGEGVSSFTPLINARNSAILGISSTDEKLKRCTLTLAFDHRVTEGRMASLFLAELRDRIHSFKSEFYSSSLKSERILLVKCYRCFKNITEDLSSTGFAKCITPTGENAYICQACFKGF